MLALFLTGIALNFVGVGILSRGDRLSTMRRASAQYGGSDGLRAELIDESMLVATPADFGANGGSAAGCACRQLMA